MNDELCEYCGAPAMFEARWTQRRRGGWERNAGTVLVCAGRECIDQAHADKPASWVGDGEPTVSRLQAIHPGVTGETGRRALTD